MNFQPIMHYHTRDKKKGNPIALRDFLSLRNEDPHFSEKYVIKIMKNSKFFNGQQLQLIEEQSHNEPDIIDVLNEDNKYEVKTFWNESGCELLSLNKDFGDVYKELCINEELEYQFSNWNKPDMYNETSKNLIEKMKKKSMDYILLMKKKPMDYILLMVNTFSLDNKNIYHLDRSIDVDVLKWQYVLNVYDFNFAIYLIKPTYYNQFTIYHITKNNIENDIINYNDFFEKYVTIEKIIFR